jgi:hypothetical protein
MQHQMSRSPGNIRLEFNLLKLIVYRRFGGVDLGVNVMTAVVDSSIAQYAVIEARRIDGPSEFFVLAYSAEELLRDLILGPSITACGFASRDEAQAQAQAKTEATFCTAAAEQQTFRKVTVDAAGKYWHRALPAKRRLGASFEPGPTREIVRGFLQAVVATAVLIFYSRNMISSLIRGFVGG